MPTKCHHADCFNNAMDGHWLCQECKDGRERADAEYHEMMRSWRALQRVSVNAPQFVHGEHELSADKAIEGRDYFARRFQRRRLPERIRRLTPITAKGITDDAA